MRELIIATIAEQPELRKACANVMRDEWPQFMRYDGVASRYWSELYRIFPEFQFVLLDANSERVVGVGNSLSLVWDGKLEDLPDEGWDWALAKGIRDYRDRELPTVQCALAITIAHSHRGKGLSQTMVEAMKEIGRTHELNHLIAPVRPIMKSRYPLIPMERYVNWKDSSGFPFDPWIRVHVALGGTITRICPRSMRITGRVAEWEEWVRMKLPDSGEYVIPGGLVPLVIRKEADWGEYVEPNVWMVHGLR